MYQVDNSTAATTMPTPAAVGPNPGGFFTSGNPAGGIAATVVDQDIMNAVMMEICNVVTGADITLSKTSQTQLYQAIQALAGIIVPGGQLTLYIATTGSDSNPGTSAEPFLTIAGAVAALAKYNLLGLTVTLSIGAGSFAGYTFNGIKTPCVINLTGAGHAVTTLVGAGGVFGATNSNAVGAQYGAQITVSGMTLTATGTGGDYKPSGQCLSAAVGGRITIGSDIVFGSSQGSHIYTQASGSIATQGLASTTGQGYTITGGAQTHISCQDGGYVTVVDAPIILSGTPAFSVAFAFCSTGAQIGIWGNTFTGSATGTKYILSANAVINTEGAASSYLPGSVAGTTASGGQYV